MLMAHILPVMENIELSNYILTFRRLLLICTITSFASSTTC